MRHRFKVARSATWRQVARAPPPPVTALDRSQPSVSERTYIRISRLHHVVMFSRFPHDEDDAMSATTIEIYYFQRQTRINQLVRLTMTASGLCVALAGIASAIITLAQM